MNKTQISKQYDLEERTFKFAEECRNFVSQLPKSIANFEYSKQLVRSSGSQAANYIEANESLSKKDFCHRVKICRKEAKESRLWLRLLLDREDERLIEIKNKLIQEATELVKIFSAIFEKSK
ncbi:four helix bundle protein [Patescibacteria group bacterium]|nr:four helix bundle protein [Patescibacteria group bacterium]